MVEVVESAGEFPVGEGERKNADYHRKGGQLCYCLSLLAICLHLTSISKYVSNKEPQAT